MFLTTWDIHFIGKKLLHEMVQKAKDEGLTINVRHAKILFCGAPQVGKTSFSRLLRNKKHKELGSTDAGHAKQVLISGKVNVIGEEWINLDRKLEMQTLTEILNLKMREQDETTEEKSSQTNSNTNREPIADNTLDVQTNNQTVTQATNSDYGNEPIQATNSDYGNEPIQATNSDYGNEPILQSISRNKPAADIQKSAQPYPTRDSTDKNESVEEEMTDISFFKLKESIPDTWDLFTFLDTGGQPEFINMLPAINASTDITFIVIDISEGRKCLNNEIKAIYKHENYEYGEQILKYSNRDLLKCLLSSAKVASTKKDQFHPELIKQVSKNKQLEKVVYIIGTFADILKKTSLTREKYDEEVCEIENEIKKLVEVIQEEGVLVCHCNEVRNYLNPIDNKVPRDFQKNVMDKESDMQAIQSNTIDTVLQIHGHANEILKNTAQYEIPFTWFILELQLRKSKKVCIPLSEVKSICDYHKIIPPHRKLKDDQIQEVLKFYHTYGMLLYFDAVEGMNNFVITDPRWLFTNLTKIVMYQFKKDVNDLDGICMQKMHNGICNLELLSKLELDLHGIELESFVKLLENLKIAARMNNSYFIPTMLPLCINTKNMFTADEFGTSVILTDDGLCKEVEPLLIKHSFGTIPRGLFGFLVVQLLQDNSKTSEKYELHGLNDRSKGLFYRCADLITFFVYPCFYVCLCDKISYLEIKIRANGNEPSYHYKAQCVITKALEQVCNRFDWAFNEHRYGFLCHKTTGSCRESPHLTLLPRDEIFPPEYAHCKNNQPTKLDVCHQIWFKVC